ncbi:MAG: CBS domain-containing protein [Betaproteobacteria bacterium]
MVLAKQVMMKEFVTAKKNDTIQDCIELLFKMHIGSIVITDDERNCLGIFTERDAIRMIAQKVPLNSPIANVMTKNVFTINESAPYKEVRNMINLHGIRHLPVVDASGKLKGLISIRQVLNEILGI